MKQTLGTEREHGRTCKTCAHWKRAHYEDSSGAPLGDCRLVQVRYFLWGQRRGSDGMLLQNTTYEGETCDRHT